MKAIIAGGGIGGLVTAVALQRAGVEATVYETGPAPAEHRGLFLGLGVNGMRVLRDLGLLEAVLGADTIATPDMVFTSWTGKRLGTISNGRLDARTPSFTIMRGKLQRALADEVQRRGIEIQYGHRIVGYEEHASAVVARFEGGMAAAGDILIGADGIRSRVRQVLSPDAPAPSYTGLLNLGGVVRVTSLPPTPGEMHMVWGRRAFFGYTVRSDGVVWWFANTGAEREPSRDELAMITTAEWKARLRALFVDDPAFISGLIEATEEIGGLPIHDMPSIPRWHSGRVALVGDAAHAVSPSAGQGASLALEDALMLARCLRDDREPARAFARYEALRRPRAERIVAAGRRRGAYKAPANRAVVYVRDLLMPIAFRLFATERTMSWVHDYEIPWDEKAA